MSILLNSKFIFFLLTFVSLGVYSQSIDFTEEEPEEQFKSFSLELSLYNKNNKSNWKDLFKEKNFEFEKIYKCGNASVKIKKPYWFKFD